MSSVYLESIFDDVPHLELKHLELKHLYSLSKRKMPQCWSCGDYCGLHKLTMKNWYPLPIILGLLDQLGKPSSIRKLMYFKCCTYLIGYEWKTIFIEFIDLLSITLNFFDLQMLLPFFNIWWMISFGNS